MSTQCFKNHLQKENQENPFPRHFSTYSGSVISQRLTLDWFHIRLYAELFPAPSAISGQRACIFHISSRKGERVLKMKLYMKPSYGRALNLLLAMVVMTGLTISTVRGQEMPQKQWPLPGVWGLELPLPPEALPPDNTARVYWGPQTGPIIVYYFNLPDKGSGMRFYQVSSGKLLAAKRNVR